jgi:hypothetical protein
MSRAYNLYSTLELSLISVNTFLRSLTFALPYYGSNYLLLPEVEPPPKPKIEPLPHLSDTSTALALPPLAIYPSKEALFEDIQSWAKLRGYAFTIARSKRQPTQRQKVWYYCDRCPPTPPVTSLFGILNLGDQGVSFQY